MDGTNDNDTRTPEETARLSQAFLVTIGKTMSQLELHPRLVIRLFGMFAARVAEIEEKHRGLDHHEAFMQVLSDFTGGLGIENAVFEKVDGEEAEQLMAEIERKTGGHPVQ